MKNITTIILISFILVELPLYAQSATPKRPLKKVEVGTLFGKLSVTPTGNAVYKIPIEVPPGIGNMTPKLSFTYNSGINGGIMGYGWSLSGLSRISRSAGTYYYNGAPKEVDFSDDQLVLDGRKLILTDQNSNEYRYEEDNMDRIIKNYEKGKENNVYFIDYTKTGLIKTYGKPLQAKLIYGNENNPALIYFINKIKDQDGNTIKYNYESHQSEGTVYLKTIEYGGTGSKRDLPNYTIEFEYTDADLAKTSFFSIGGTESRYKYRQDKLLKSVIIMHKEQELRRYTINYETGGLLNEKYLKNITLETPGSEYKKTVFDWEYYYRLQSDGTDDILFNKSFNYWGSDFAAPKIVNGDFNGDGITDIAVFYEGRIINGRTEYGKMDLNLSNGGSFTNVLQYTFPHDVQIMGSGDFIGDGKSEILFTYNLDLDYDVIAFLYNSTNQTYEVEVHYAFDSPASKGFVGDYNGDGISDFITYDNDGNLRCYKGTDYSYEFDGSISPVYIGKDFKIYTGDFDGGGKTELLVADKEKNEFIKVKLNYDNNSFEQYTVNFTNSSNKSINNIFYHKFFKTNMPTLTIGDFNNDGKDDIVTSAKDNDKLGFYFSYGYDFEYQKTIIIKNDGVLSRDLNGDGRSDIIILTEDGDSRVNATYYYIKKDGTTIEKGVTTDIIAVQQGYRGYVAQINFGRYTGTKKFDICTSVVKYYEHPNRDIDWFNVVRVFYRGINSFNKINFITNGLDKKTRIDYESVKTTEHYRFNGSEMGNIDYPLVKYTPSSFVVTQILQDNGQDAFFKPEEYYYKNGITHKLGKGFLGFKEFTVNDKKNNKYVVNKYGIFGKEQYKFYKPYVKTQSKSVVDDNGVVGQTYTTTVNTINNKITTANDLVFFTYLENMQTDYFLLNSGIKYKTVTVNNKDYDIYGNVGKTTITSTATSLGSKTYVTETLYQYCNDPVIENDKWSIGKITDITVTKKFKDNTTIKPIIKHTVFNYYKDRSNPLYGKLKLKAFAPEDPNSQSVSYTEYDDYGNILTTENNAYLNPEPDLARTNSFEYGDFYYNRFVTKIVNPKGQETLYEYNQNWGWITKITESDKLETSIRYIDDFGKQFMEILPDITYYQINYFWVSDNDQDKPEYAVYYKDETNSAKPEIKTYYDKLNRQLRIVTSNSTGVIYRDFYYDSNTGLLIYETKPYFKGDEIYRIHYEYDKLGRITGKYLPGDRDYYYSYNGLTLTISNPKRQTITKHYSSNNDLISVTNNLNISTNYVYDPDGKVISAMIQDKEKTEITATYDTYGNITSIIDPALGKKEFEYDFFGQLIKVKHNDFIEQKDFKYDKLGRILEKDEPEVGHTIFSYDNQFAGKLDDITFNNYTNSDNYKTSFIYDEYDRVKQTNENIIHNGNSNDFSTIYSYSRRDGQLETLEYPSGLKIEYEYNNGDVVKIKRMADEKILWRLGKKNALGQLENFSYGNGIYTTKNYYPETGFLKNIFSSQPMLNRDFGHQIQNNTYYLGQIR